MLDGKHEHFALRLGIRIMQIRREMGLLQQQLADCAGINAGYLSLIENGQRLPSLAMLSRLSKILRVPLFELFVFSKKNASSRKRTSPKADG